MALRVANRILGGTFSSRLVAVIREQKGFTYSIRSELAEPDGVFDGHWQVGLSLSPQWLDAGLDATRAEIERFANDGVSAPELATRQLETVSGFQVGLSTVGGSSQAILFGAERGFGAGFIHDFAEKIQDITPAQLNRAIQLNLHPAGSHTVVVGPA
jgi:predicted Zn-dependent peptidase